MRRARPLLLGPVLLATALAGATACAGGDAAPADPREGVPSAAAPAPTAAPAASPAAAALPLPLTGLPASSPAAAALPIVAVPVDVGPGLPAPTGLGDADVVFVSFPSASRQRALALFQSRDGGSVGPVGDVRPVDSKLLLALGAVLEHSGGSSGFLKQVDRAELPSWSSVVNPSSFRREGGYYYGATATARGAAGVQPARPGLLPFDPAPAAAPAPPAPVRVAVPGQAEAVFTYDAASATWRGALGGLPVAATNVVVQQVDQPALEIPKTGGRTEGNPDVNGTGAATVLAGPRVGLGATWNRPGGLTNTKYVLADGSPARLVPGTTWVLLVPAGTPVASP